jgi:hypothetical protein
MQCCQVIVRVRAAGSVSHTQPRPVSPHLPLTAASWGISPHPPDPHRLGFYSKGAQNPVVGNHTRVLSNVKGWLKWHGMYTRAPWTWCRSNVRWRLIGGPSRPSSRPIRTPIRPPWLSNCTPPAGAASLLNKYNFCSSYLVETGLILDLRARRRLSSLLCHPFLACLWRR